MNLFLPARNRSTIKIFNTIRFPKLYSLPNLFLPLQIQYDQDSQIVFVFMSLFSIAKLNMIWFLKSYSLSCLFLPSQILIIIQFPELCSLPWGSLFLSMQNLHYNSDSRIVLNVVSLLPLQNRNTIQFLKLYSITCLLCRCK